MGRFEPGQKKPTTSGRKTGTRNKKTEHLKEFFEKENFDIPAKLLHLLPQLSPAKQADILIDLMSYVFPKLKNVEIEKSFTPEPQQIRIHFVDAKDGKPVSNP